jgi:hypothetical protein
MLGDDQKVTLRVKFVTGEGNPAKVDGTPAWDTSNEDLFELDPSDDGMTCVLTATGPLGVGQVSVSADADLGTGTKDIIGTLEVEVVAGEAIAAVLETGAPEKK